MKKSTVLIVCILIALIADNGYSEQKWSKTNEETVFTPQFLCANEYSDLAISAVFCVGEEWKVVHWAEIMSECGIPEQNQMAVESLMRVDRNYRTGTIESNSYAIVFYHLDSVVGEVVCYANISSVAVDLLRKGELRPFIKDMTHIWRSSDNLLLGKTKEKRLFADLCGWF